MARYVDADKAIEIITELVRDTVIEDADVVASEVREAFISMPTADVREVKHGHWVDDNDPSEWTCSECHYRVMRYNNTAFCPNCGSDMRGGE